MSLDQAAHRVHVERPPGRIVFVCSCGQRCRSYAGSAPSRLLAVARMVRHLNTGTAANRRDGGVR